jgi:hypothetical protein
VFRFETIDAPSKNVLIFMLQIIDKLNSILGADLIASIIAAVMSFFGVFGAALYLTAKTGSFSKLPVEPLLLKAPNCPGCNRPIEALLNRRDPSARFIGYHLREIRCECLTLSVWDSLGLPVLLEHRPPNAAELEAHYSAEARRNRDRKIDDLKKLISKAKKAQKCRSED